MAVLVLAEHDGKTVRKATLNTVAAAQKIGGEIHVLVAGHNCAEAAKAAAAIAGVAKVLHADAASLAEELAENVASLIVSMAKNYSHILAPATSTGKNILPRAAALLDCQQISEIIAVDSPDTFVRPIYAGNALATVKSADRDVELGGDDLAGLADLPVIRHEAGVDRGARGAHGGAELVGEGLEHLGEVLARPHAAAAGDDDLRGGELRALGLGNFARHERGQP